MTARQVYLKRVDLPPMFGPVTKINDWLEVITVSFGINAF
jgi:hypothetical protein